MPDPTSTIRLFTDEDLEACVAICAANHPEYIFLHEIEEHREFLTKKPYEPAPYYVVEVEGELVQLDRERMAILRDEPGVGAVVVHFPRLEYDLRQK